MGKCGFWAALRAPWWCVAGDLEGGSFLHLAAQVQVWSRWSQLSFAS